MSFFDDVMRETMDRLREFNEHQEENKSDAAQAISHARRARMNDALTALGSDIRLSGSMPYTDYFAAIESAIIILLEREVERSK